MPVPVTVVISCAGSGRRLGLSKTKALAHICGRPMIEWQLTALRGVADIRIVVGYQAGELIDCVRALRNDVLFAFNHDFSSTGTAASLVAGSRGALDFVVSLDGDLLVRPAELRQFIDMPLPTLGVVDPTSSEPLLATLDDIDGTSVVRFGYGHYDAGTLEWSGLCKLRREQIEASSKMGLGMGHVYELITPHLPMPCVRIDAREIDTPDDFERAEQWLARHLAACDWTD